MGENIVAINTDPKNCKLNIAIKRDGEIFGSLDINTREAARLAVMILSAANKCFHDSGRPTPPAHATSTKIESIAPSGHTVVLDQTSSVMPVFCFGDTVLGIELSNQAARILGQQLLTLSADQDTRQ